MLITHEFEWGFRKTRCLGLFGNLSLSDTENGACINMVVGLYKGELCDGFNVVESYTASRNRREQKIIQMILVFL